MSLLDSILYYNEDTDGTPAEWTPIKPSHIIELYARGLLALDETIAHKGWYHHCTEDEYGVIATMWNGIDGEEYMWCDEDGGDEW